MTQIIGLVGSAGSGKDTAGDILASNGFKRDSFAKPVKDATAAIFGWERAKLDGYTPEDRVWRELPCPYWSAKMGKPFSPRKALQLMGTECGREVYHQNLWVDALERRLVADTDMRGWVITDVRFVNEMEMIKRLGGKIYLIVRGEPPFFYNDAKAYNFHKTLDPDTPLPASLKDIHISEWGWIGSPLIDWTIHNNSTLADFEAIITSLIDSYS